MSEYEWPTRLHVCIIVCLMCIIHRPPTYIFTHIHTTGISPWKIGMLAANLYLWDIMWAKIEPPAFREDWKVGKSHIERAYQLMHVFGKIRTTHTHMSIT